MSSRGAKKAVHRKAKTKSDRKNVPKDTTVDDARVLEMVNDMVARFRHVEIIELEIYRENVAEEIAQTGEEYTRIPLSKIPVKSKLVVKLKIVDPDSGREVDARATSSSNENGALQSPSHVEVPDFGTLPDETGKDKKVKKGKLEKILNLAVEIIQILIQILNMLRGGTLAK